MIPNDVYLSICERMFRHDVDHDIVLMLQALGSGDFESVKDFKPTFNHREYAIRCREMSHPDAVAHVLDVTDEFRQLDGLNHDNVMMVAVADKDGEPMVVYVEGNVVDGETPTDEHRAAYVEYVRDKFVELGFSREQAEEFIQMENSNIRSKSEFDRQAHRKMQEEIDREVFAFRDQINTSLDDMFGGG